VESVKIGHRRRGGLSLAQPMRSDRRHPVKLFAFLKKLSTIFII
jgi:hypothetical protein